MLLRGRVGGGVGLLAVVVVVALSARPLGADLVGDRGLVVAAVRVVEILGLGVAVYAGGRRVLAPRHAVAERRRYDWYRLLQFVGLLGLCAIGAELLAAYGDSTGDPAGVAFALVLFAALYGAPALLARELVRRFGWGWPSLLLLFAALGTAQACLIDQAMFSVDYQGYEGWEAIREATLVPALGISALNAYNFVVGHVIISFAAPVALAEAWVPARAGKPWLGRVGIVLAVLAYAGSAAMIVSDSESRSATPVQLGVSAGLVAAFVAAAFVVGRRARGAQETGRRFGLPPGTRRPGVHVLSAPRRRRAVPEVRPQHDHAPGRHPGRLLRSPTP